jgi:acyl-coenzyme A thioesterase 9
VLTLTSLDRVPPSSDEAKVLHDFFLANGKTNGHQIAMPKNGVERISMKSTRLQNCFMMFPQERK